MELPNLKFEFVFFCWVALRLLNCDAITIGLKADITLETTHHNINNRNNSRDATRAMLRMFTNCNVSFYEQSGWNICWRKDSKDIFIHHIVMINVSMSCNTSHITRRSFFQVRALSPHPVPNGRGVKALNFEGARRSGDSLKQDIKSINSYFNDSNDATNGDIIKKNWPTGVLRGSMKILCGTGTVTDWKAVNNCNQTLRRTGVVLQLLNCDAITIGLKADITLETTHHNINNRNNSQDATRAMLRMFPNCNVSLYEPSGWNICWRNDSKDNFIHHIVMIDVTMSCSTSSGDSLKHDIKSINNYFKESNNRTNGGINKRNWPTGVFSGSMKILCGTETVTDWKAVNNCNQTLRRTGSSMPTIENVSSCTDVGGNLTQTSVSIHEEAMTSIPQPLFNHTTEARSTSSYVQISSTTDKLAWTRTTHLNPVSMNNTGMNNATKQQQPQSDKKAMIIGSTVGALATVSGLVAAASIIRRKCNRGRVDPDQTDQSDTSSINSDSPFFVPTEFAREIATGTAPIKTVV